MLGGVQTRMEINETNSVLKYDSQDDNIRKMYEQTATNAMVLSIVGMAVFFLPVINIAGLILSIIGLVKSKRNRSFGEDNGIGENGNNKTAFICGIIGIVLNTLSILIYVAGATLVAGLIAYFSNDVYFSGPQSTSWFFDTMHFALSERV